MTLKEYKNLEDKNNDKIIEDFNADSGTVTNITKFYDHYVVNTVEEFDRHYDKYKGVKKESEKNIFRGVSEAKYKMYSSAQRDFITKDLSKLFSFHDFVQKLIDSFKNPNNGVISRYFKSMGILEHDLLYLSLMQHSGVPTPLLDFTKSFDVALYFSIANNGAKNWGGGSNKIDNYSSIYCIEESDNFSVEGLLKSANNITGVDETLSWDKTISNLPLLIPSKQSSKLGNPGSSMTNTSASTLGLTVWSNLNMVAQQGAFFSNPNEKEPLEYHLLGINYPAKLCCIDFHKNLSNYIAKKISKETLKYSLFPSFEKLASDAYLEATSNL